MTRSRPKRLRLLLILVPAILALNGCALLGDAFNFLPLMTPEEEIAFGERVREQVEKDLTLVDDATVVDYVRKVGNIVVSNSPRGAVVPTEFFVIANDEINAFAIPGGRIYVHTGLINASNDEAELASVLAHEFGHVVYRHSAEQMRQAMGLQLFQDVLLGEEPSEFVTMIAGISSQGGLNYFSREDELEADSIAVPTLYNAGYDPTAIVTFFEKLKEKYGETSGALTFLASHPPTTERINQVAARINALPPKEELYRPITELRRVQARLDQLGLAGN